MQILDENKVRQIFGMKLILRLSTVPIIPEKAIPLVPGKISGNSNSYNSS